MGALLYLITHAHTEAVPTVEAPAWTLSEVGRRQAEALAALPLWSQVDRILLSSERKTWHTVEPLLARRRLPVDVDASFDELRRSGWSDDYGRQVAAVFAEPERSIDGWEPAAAAQQRFLAGLAAARRRHPTAVLAHVGHGLTLSLYRAALLGRAMADLAAWQRLPFCAVAVVDADAGRLVHDFVAVAGVCGPARG